jgi:hypothetical protein
MNKVVPRPVIARCLALAIAAAGGAGLAGCSGFLPGAPLIPVEFQSTPSGAEARTSMGQSCKTTCSIRVADPEDDFTVSPAMRSIVQKTPGVAALLTMRN